jgi:hypothetical protein
LLRLASAARGERKRARSSSVFPRERAAVSVCGGGILLRPRRFGGDGWKDRVVTKLLECLFFNLITGTFMHGQVINFPPTLHQLRIGRAKVVSIPTSVGSGFFGPRELDTFFHVFFIN